MGSRKQLRPTPPPSEPALVRPAIGALIVTLGGAADLGCKKGEPPMVDIGYPPMAQPMDDAPPPMPPPTDEPPPPMPPPTDEPPPPMAAPMPAPMPPPPMPPPPMPNPGKAGSGAPHVG